MREVVRSARIGLMLVVLTLGCQRGPEAEVVVEATEVLPFENVGVGASASLTDTTEVILYTPEAWENYRARLRSVGPFKPVDFSQEMVVLVAVPVPSGGYSVEVESVEKAGDEVVVHYVLYTPDRACIPVEGTAVPYQVVKARRAEGSPRFVRRTEPFPCTLE